MPKWLHTWLRLWPRSQRPAQERFCARSVSYRVWKGRPQSQSPRPAGLVRDPHGVRYHTQSTEHAVLWAVLTQLYEVNAAEAPVTIHPSHSLALIVRLAIKQSLGHAWMLTSEEMVHGLQISNPASPVPSRRHRPIGTCRMPEMRRPWRAKDPSLSPAPLPINHEMRRRSDRHRCPAWHLKHGEHHRRSYAYTPPQHLSILNLL